MIVAYGAQNPADRRSALLTMKRRLRRTQKHRSLSPIRLRRLQKERTRSTYKIGAATRHRIRQLKGQAFLAYCEAKRLRQMSLPWRDSKSPGEMEFVEVARFG